MGYYIQYETNIVKTQFRTRTNGKKTKLTGIAILLVVTILGYAAYSYKDAIQDFILPGDANVTAAALDVLVEDIRKGDSLKDAVTAFCVEILEDARIAN